MPLVVQVMGKRRGEVMVPAGTDGGSADALHEAVRASELFGKWLEGREVKRIIPVPRKGGFMVNYVLGK